MPIFNEQFLRLEEWVELIKSRNFHRLLEKLQSRVRSLDSEIKNATERHNLDGGISLLVLHARKNEVESLMGSFKFYEEEHKRLKNVHENNKETPNE